MRRLALASFIGLLIGAGGSSVGWMARIDAHEQAHAAELSKLHESNKFLRGFSDRLHRDVLLWRTNVPFCAAKGLAYSRLREDCVPVAEADTEDVDRLSGR